MAEAKQLKKIQEELNTLRTTSREKIFACIEITAILNEVFGNYGVFTFTADFPLAPGCEKVEGSHLQAHINAEITRNKKNYSFGSADAPYLTNPTGNLSKTSKSLLQEREHVQIARNDFCAKMIKLHYENQLLQATGFSDYCFELNHRTYESNDLPDMHCTPDGWLRKGKRMIPVEIYDLTKAAENKRETYLKSNEGRATSEEHKQKISQMHPDGEVITVRSGPVLSKRDPLILSAPKAETQLPCFMLPSTKIPIRHERDTGLLSNITADRPEIGFAEEPTFAKQPGTKFVPIDLAKGFRTAFKTQLSRKYRQCVAQIAITSAAKGLLLFWDQNQCTVYHHTILRDERFDSVLASLMSAAPEILAATYASESEEEIQSDLLESGGAEAQHQLRSLSVSTKSKPAKVLKGTALLEDYRKRTDKIAQQARLTELERIATEENFGKDNPESSSEHNSDQNWAQEKKKGKPRGPYKKRQPKA